MIENNTFVGLEHLYVGHSQHMAQFDNGENLVAHCQHKREHLFMFFGFLVTALFLNFMFNRFS